MTEHLHICKNLIYKNHKYEKSVFRLSILIWGLSNIVNTLNSTIHVVLNCYLMSVYMSQSFGLQVTEAGTTASFSGNSNMDLAATRLVYLLSALLCMLLPFTTQQETDASSFSPHSSPNEPLRRGQTSL